MRGNVGAVFVFVFSSRRRNTRCALVTGVQTCALPISTSEAWQALMREQVEAARRHLLSGRYVAGHLPGRISLELKLVTQGGLAILDKLEASDYNMRSEERRVGKECVRKGRSQRSPDQ